MKVDQKRNARPRSLDGKTPWSMRSIATPMLGLDMFLLNSRVYIRSGAQTRCDLSYWRLRFAALKGYAKCTITIMKVGRLIPSLFSMLALWAPPCSAQAPKLEDIRVSFAS